MSDKHCPIQKRDCMDCCAWNIDGECAIAIMAKRKLPYVIAIDLGKSEKDVVIHGDFDPLTMDRKWVKGENKCDVESLEEDRKIQNYVGG